MATCPERILDVTVDKASNPIFGVKDAKQLSIGDCVALAKANDPALASVQTGGIVFLANAFAARLKDPVLSLDEVAAIHVYTQASPWYRILNARLRAEERELLKPYFPYIRLLLTALYKLPQQSCVLYRGVKRNLHSDYPSGSLHTWWACSSCASRVDVMSSDLFLGKTGDRTLFNIVVSTGVDIQRYSAIPSEGEILLLPGTCVQVDAAFDAGNGLQIVQMKEVVVPGLIDYDRSMVNAEEQKSPFSVGLDIGNATTGFAIAYVSSGEVQSFTPGGDGTEKDETALLFDLTNALVGFGEQAISRFSEQQLELKLFQYFMLYLSRPLSAKVRVKSVGGRHELELFFLVTETLRYVKNCALAKVHNLFGREVPASLIQWVVTVPAIWSDPARDFMRRASVAAGLISTLQSDSLQLALEPEAAAVGLAVETGHASFRQDARLVILDCGSGTVDITAHTVCQVVQTPRGPMPRFGQEMQMAPVGGPWGEKYLDAAFLDMFLCKLLDAATMRDFKESPEYPSFMSDTWGPLKRQIGSASEADYLRLNLSMLGVRAATIESAVKKWNENSPHQLIHFGRTFVRIPVALLKSLYENPTLRGIESTMDSILEKLPQQDCILIVGSYGDSSVIQDRIRTRYGEKFGVPVLSSQQSGVLVEKGAALMGIEGYV